MNNILKINHESDFQFQYKLGADYTHVPFKLIFYTIDIEDNFYTVSFDGTTYTNCSVANDGESIIASLNSPQLYPGNLRIRIELYLDSASFNDGIYNQVHVEKTNVYIVTTPSNCHNVIYEGSNIASLDAYNIEQNVEQALNEIQDKSESLNADIEYLDEALERLSDAINTVEDFEELISSLVSKEELISCSYATTAELGQYMTEDEVTDYLDDYYDSSYIDSNFYSKDQIDTIVNTINSQQDLSSYVSYTYLESKNYLQSRDLEEYATMTWVHTQNYLTLNDIDDLGNINVLLDGYVKYTDVDFNSYVTKDKLSSCGYITMADVSSCGYITSADIPTVDLSGYVSKSELSSCGYLTQHQSLSDYVQRNEIENAGYMTSEEVNTAILNAQLIQVDINLDDYALKSDIPEQLWERGSGGECAIKTTYAYDASGDNSIAEGWNTYAIGRDSHAEGNGTKAIGKNSHSEGKHSYAVGESSHVEGYYNFANDNYAHAEGYKNTAYGLGAHVEGQFNSTYGDGAHSEGYYTVAYGQGAHGEGRYNKFNGNTLSSIGFGSVENGRRNAFEVMQNGDIYAYGVGNYDGTNPESAYTLKETVDNLSERIDKFNVENLDLSSYVTKTELSSCGYLTSHQSLDDYATKLYVEDTIGDATSLLDLILGEDGTTVDPAAIPALTNYVTKNELTACGYLTSHQSLSNYATKNYVDSAIESASFDASQIDLSSYVSKAELSGCGYITAEDIPTIDLTGYATESYVTSKVNGIKPVSYTIRNTYNLSVWSGTLSQYNALSNHTSYQLYLIAEG